MQSIHFFKRKIEITLKMSKLEMRINAENRGSGESDSAIEPQLHWVLREAASALIGFETPYNSWLETNDESALVFKRNLKFLNFY
jgi:hypothetical protein